MRKRLGNAPRRGSMSGVTLIELVVTLGIAMIMLMVAVPSFQGVVRVNRIATLTNELSSTLQLARSEAITRGQAVSVCETDDLVDDTPTCNPADGNSWHLGWLVFADDDDDGDLDASETLLRLGRLSAANATILSDDSNFADYIKFSSDGRSEGSTGSDGAIATCVASEERDLVFNTIGRLRLDQDLGICP